MLADPESWLAARLAADSPLPSNIPTIIDGVDDLEVWTRQQLTACLQPADWNDLMQSGPMLADAILEGRVMLTRAFFQHPAKPEECYLLETAEQNILEGLFERIEPNSLIPAAWRIFGSGGKQTENCGGRKFIGRLAHFLCSARRFRWLRF
jgi:ATP-dependent DNA helicase DinG